jgi:ribonuclease P/MRP protein subunit POP5
LECIFGVEVLRALIFGFYRALKVGKERYLNGRAGGEEQRDVVFEDEPHSAVVRDRRVDVAGADGFAGATRLDFE